MALPAQVPGREISLVRTGTTATDSATSRVILRMHNKVLSPVLPDRMHIRLSRSIPFFFFFFLSYDISRPELSPCS